MQIEFLKPGLQTSLQDSGFSGYMQDGVSTSGAMDQMAMKLANWLVSKPANSAVLEITLIGPTIKFNSEMQIAICGAYFDCVLNATKVENNKTISVRAGDILKFNRLNSGSRAYLAFTGLLKQPKFLNSHSTNLSVGFGANFGKSFKACDKISFDENNNSSIKVLPKKLQISYSNHMQIRVTQGIEVDHFDGSNRDLFYSQTHEVTKDSNRMGLRLNSTPIKVEPKQSMTSTGISQGTIQIPNNGQPIITSVEGQTIGGYPRIANIIRADLHMLGQLKANDRINFVKVDADYAQQLWKQKNSLLRFVE